MREPSLLWVLPAQAAAEPSASAKEIRERLIERGDALAVTGLTGAPDQMLRSGEVAAHLEWAVHNSWGSGIADRNEAVRYCLFRPAADLRRTEVLELYRGHAEPIGLVATESARPVFCDTEGRVFRPIATVESTAADNEDAELRVRRSLRSATRGYPANAGPIVLIEAGTPEETLACIRAAAALASAHHEDLLADLFADHAQRRDGDLLRFSRLLPVSLTQPRPSTLDAVGTLRTRRASKIGTRRILEAAAQTGDHAETGRSAAPTGERAIVATMHGEAALDGDDCYALLDAGRLAGVWSSMQEAKTPLVSRSLLVPSQPRARAVPDDSRGCVSFETDESRGAVSDFLLEGDGVSVLGQVVYSTVLGHQGLIVTQSIVASADSDATLLMHGLPVPVAHLQITAFHGTDEPIVTDSFESDTTIWGEAFDIWIPEMQMSVVALTAEGATVPWCVSFRRKPTPRLFFGPQRETINAGVVETSTLLVTPGASHPANAGKTLRRSLPEAVVRELRETRLVTSAAVSAQRAE